MGLEHYDGLEWVNQETGEIATAPPPFTSYASEHVYRVPDDDLFGDEAFLEAPDLEKIASHLRSHHFYFNHLEGMLILYRWKREGGKTGGKLTTGKCSTVSGLLRFETGADFVIWLAADHCRGLRMTERQVEALLFHELLHTDITEKGKPTTRAHDATLFTAELRHYGLWTDDLERIGMAVKQLKFFEDEEDEGEL